MLHKVLYIRSENNAEAPEIEKILREETTFSLYYGDCNFIQKSSISPYSIAPNVVLIDLETCKKHGNNTITEIIQKFPSASVIGIHQNAENEDLDRFLAHGLEASLLVDELGDTLISTIYSSLSKSTL